MRGARGGSDPSGCGDNGQRAGRRTRTRQPLARYALSGTLFAEPSDQASVNHWSPRPDRCSRSARARAIRSCSTPRCRSCGRNVLTSASGRSHERARRSPCGRQGWSRGGLRSASLRASILSSGSRGAKSARVWMQGRAAGSVGGPTTSAYTHRLARRGCPL